MLQFSRLVNELLNLGGCCNHWQFGGLKIEKERRIKMEHDSFPIFAPIRYAPAIIISVKLTKWIGLHYLPK